MPPKRARISQNDPQQEGRVLLAIQAIQTNQIPSIRQAARTFNVPRSTLQDRLAGTSQRNSIRANSHKLTETEEITLHNWIISLDDRGAGPRPAMVREMANLLLAQRCSSTVGQKWVYNFIQRHPDIATRFTRRYDYQRAKNEDPRVIQAWFDLVQRTIETNGIAAEDIYNFDETGFAMGLVATTKVVTRAEYYGKRKILQPGNREWVTSIESINAAGWALPPVIIFKGKNFIESWFDDLPHDWRIEVSQNGWTTDEIGLRWLQNHFIPITSTRTHGKFRLLILDGHGSHLTPKFDQICEQHAIIPICMPPHSSHILQPLDVGCFAVLKRAYGGLVEQQMRLGFNHIDKLDFLAAYPNARSEPYKPETIQHAFAATGLVPFDPNRVLSKLDIYIRTPTPPGSRQSNQSSDLEPKTPKNIRQLHRQASSIKALISRNSTSPPNQALDQLIKGCELAIQAGTLLAKENHDLRAANEKAKQKRARSKRQIAHDGGLSAQEAQALIQGPKPAEIGPQDPPEPAPPAAISTPTPAPRAPGRCSGCGELGHTYARCQNRQFN